ncbi:MAG: hypothetical protein N3E36_03265 [Sulfolobales archaeon]|nr:hypothetical protein [Sulfolobales archaeon]MCX8199034.1 hypothetical protein [Sulfolobales archaeon]MDW8170013.1 hypothetical protein [Desulfurococcaceae archaeon]
MVFGKKRDPVKLAFKTLTALKHMHLRLNNMVSRIEGRRQYLLERAIQLEEMNHTILARKYTEEASRLEALMNRVSSIALVVEKVILALETNIEMRRLKDGLKDIIEIVEQLKKLPEATIPELAIAIHEVEANVKELAEIDLGGPEPSFIQLAPSQNAVELLKEAKEIAQKRLSTTLTPP